MARWTPGAKERLQAAAFDVISERGFDAVTVAEIARAAGVTERTFYRHFADKREVFFSGQSVLVDTIAQALADVDAAADATTVVRQAFGRAVTELFPVERRTFSRARGAVIQTDAGLIERESLKMRALSDAVSAALRERGTTEPEASLVAQAAVGVFDVAFRQWIADAESRPLDVIQDAMFDRLSALLRPGSPS